MVYEQKQVGRSKGTPNASNATIRQMMREYVVSEFEFIQMHLHQLTVGERASLYKSLIRYGLAPLAPKLVLVFTSDSHPM